MSFSQNVQNLAFAMTDKKLECAYAGSGVILALKSVFQFVDEIAYSVLLMGSRS